ncbi:M56 family metallopeptidase [Polaribacter sp. Hel1_85]|uniref:M56 family metallopeptidase n=1 Tax=Polaribacter sp. Hel1_85 TaxID=1250005 RepID=UPI00052C948D|nr:M56 family metallopeptidase [Polaribacter sp. Hel1_85]KGL58915.1 peptidase BlaR1, M56 family [Polaribacter sp. Hel1_85]
MMIYLLKSASCLALLLFFYHFILEKEKMHNFNRFYLLGSVLASFLVPMATITIEATQEIIPETAAAIQSFVAPTFIENATAINFEENINYTQLLIGFYLIISTILLIRFIKNLFKIIRKISVNEKVKYKKATLILLNDNILPHTFWNYIFINKSAYKNDKIEKELFTHELTHVTQKHTLDVILIEILQIVLWINPLFIFLKKAIQLNHEFLADSTVINQHKNTFQYQHLLLNKAAWKNEYYLASNLNYSLTKKRLLMMTTQSSHTKILLKKLAVIPLLAGFIFLFAERVEAQNDNTIETIYEEPDNIKTKNLNKKQPLETIKEVSFTNQNEAINTGFKIIKGNRYYFVSVGNKTKYYNKDGKLANSFGKIISFEKAKSSTIIPGNYVTKTYFENKVFCEFINDKPYVKNDTIPKKTSATKAEMREYKALLTEGKKGKIFKERDIVRMQYLYNLMSKKQKRSVENVFELIPPPPPPKKDLGEINITPKKPTYIHQNVKRKLISQNDLDLINPKEIASMNVIKAKDTDSIHINLKKEHKKLKTKYLYLINYSKEKSKNLNSENVQYYLDNKLISKKEMKLLDTDKIKSVNVKKNKDGSGIIYITSKKN